MKSTPPDRPNAMAKLVFEIPLHTVSAANSREHWAKKAKRVKAERSATALSILAAKARNFLQGCPYAGKVVVSLTRLAPRGLDPGDNLPASLKAVRDEIAKAMNLDDRDPKVAWVYSQERGEPKEYAVIVHVRTWA